MSGAILEGTKVRSVPNREFGGSCDPGPRRHSGNPTPPIEFVTENGFCILRLCSLQPATVDSVGECHFVVRNPGGEEGELVVGFDEAVITQVQRHRHIPLSDVSLFWLTLAEQHLATYIWKNDHSPLSKLVISNLTGGDLSLAARWTD